MLLWHGTELLMTKLVVLVGNVQNLTLVSLTKLGGIMGVHVDDTALGGSGHKFTEAVAALRARFPYRNRFWAQENFVAPITSKTRFPNPFKWVRNCLPIAFVQPRFPRGSSS